jgi:hypothetical protein
MYIFEYIYTNFGGGLFIQTFTLISRSNVDLHDILLFRAFMICGYLYMDIGIYICMYIHMHGYTYIYIYEYLYINMYIHVHIYKVSHNNIFRL